MAGAEWAARAAALGLIAWMLAAMLGRGSRATSRRAADGPALADSLAAWSADARAESLWVRLDTAPGPVTRAWLRALSRAGSQVTWSAAHATPVVIAMIPLADPAGGARILVSAPRGARVRVADQVSMLDSALVRGPARSMAVPPTYGAVSARVTLPNGDTAVVARTVPRTAPPPRAVLVIGAAGWESKFVILALEERGWSVQARVRLTPTMMVTQGATPIDTAHVSAVVALDSTADADAGAIARFVRDGGGLVLAGRTAASPPLRALAAGGVGARVVPAALAFTSDMPRRALGFWPVAPLTPNAVALEMRDGRVAAAARRLDAGRVVQLGYDDTWRWRFADGDDAPAAHRAWWSAVVASVAYRSEAAATTRPPTAARLTLDDPAPFAATVAALGPPVRVGAFSATHPRQSGGGSPLRLWVLPVILLLLLFEWGSRRWRGMT